MFSGDFVRIDQHDLGVDGEEPSIATFVKWTDQERLLLLEGIEMFEDDWDKIANHVGDSKSKQDCIAHFLQLPIEDSFLAANQADLGPLQYSRLPLSRAENPVLGVVSFLASIVDPKVAAAAAGSAISELTSSLKQTSTAESVSDEAQNQMNGDSGKYPSNIQKAASTALGTAAAKSQLLATLEDTELHTLVRQVVDTQISKLEMKMAQFEELESSLEAEKRIVESLKAQLNEERINVARTSLQLSELLKRATTTQPALLGSMAPDIQNALSRANMALTMGQPARAIPVTQTQLQAQQMGMPGYGTNAVYGNL